MLNELEILKKLLPQLDGGADILVGPGDDCAVVKDNGEMDWLMAVDQVIENIHFTPETPPEIAGAKLMKRNLSDIAAMGGVPRFALLTLAINGKDSDYAVKFALGVQRAGAVYQVKVIGGDTAKLPTSGVVATLSIIGCVEPRRALLRSGARVGDALYVTGKIGNSFRSGRHLSFTPRLAEGRALINHATAALDISDGPLLDAKRLSVASKVNLRIDTAKIPLHNDATAPEAWSDGEDYELLFTAPPGLEKVWSKDLTPITRIGECVAGNGEITDMNDKIIKQEKLGYVH